MLERERERERGGGEREGERGFEVWYIDVAHRQAWCFADYLEQEREREQFKGEGWREGERVGDKVGRKESE